MDLLQNAGRIVPSLVACLGLIFILGVIVKWFVDNIRFGAQVKRLQQERVGYDKMDFLSAFEDRPLNPDIVSATYDYLIDQLPGCGYPIFPDDSLVDEAGIFNAIPFDEVVDDLFGWGPLSGRKERFRVHDIQDRSGVEEIVTVEDLILWLDEKYKRFGPASEE